MAEEDIEGQSDRTGNVAQYATEKLIELGAKVVTLRIQVDTSTMKRVSTSGLEMAQNATFSSWSRKEVDTKLHNIMISIHAQARAAAEMYGQPDNYVLGANAAGFSKVADAMIAQGVV